MTKGRPRLYPDPDALAAKVDEYFAEREASGKPPTIAGLCYFLGFSHRNALQEYEDYGLDYSCTVKRARLRIENERAERLIGKDTFTPGLIFDLKNNHGWKDKSEADLNLGGQPDNPVITRVELVAVQPDHDDASD